MRTIFEMRIDISKLWNQQLDKFPIDNRDVYFREEYVRLYETDTEKAVCCVVSEGEQMMLLPYLCRTFEFQGNEYHDFETAYGYGGPVWNNADDTFKKKALRFMVEELGKQNYIAGFVRFHPLLQNQGLFDSVGRLIADRHTVAINLDQSIDDVWSNEIHSKNRNVIRKAEKAGCTFVVDEKYEHLKDFIRLYDSTMDKLSADGFYYFDDNYYKHLVEGIPNSFLGCVKDAEGKIISAAIFMFSGSIGHYHLSGSDRSQLSLSPNNMMLWEAAKELQKRGVKRFHLGGGTTGNEDDSLFLFKRRFSKDTCQFYIGKLVFNQNIYDAICADWVQKNPDKAEHYKHHLLKYKY